MKTFQPMLAANPFPDLKHTDTSEWEQYIEQQLRNLVYPLIGTPKVDGIRSITINFAYVPLPGGISVPVSRSLKPIRNPNVQRIIGQLPHGIDGELVALDKNGKPDFRLSESVIMDYQGGENFEYLVFDYLSPDAMTDAWLDPQYQGSGKIYRRYISRDDDLKSVLEKSLTSEVLRKKVKKLPTRFLNNYEELAQFEDECIHLGYEGICVRAPHSPYKFGRSTNKEGWLIKVKRFEDAEATVVSYYELMHNYNDLKQNELVPGAKRKTFKEGMVPGGTLGGVTVMDKDGIVFDVGSGFSHSERVEYWKNPAALVGKIVKYKHQPHGRFEKPRIATFIGFRDKEDITPDNVF